MMRFSLLLTSIALAASSEEACPIYDADLDAEMDLCYEKAGTDATAVQDCTNRYARECGGVLVTVNNFGLVKASCVVDECEQGACLSRSFRVEQPNLEHDITEVLDYTDEFAECSGRLGVAKALFGVLKEDFVVDCCLSMEPSAECLCVDVAQPEDSTAVPPPTYEHWKSGSDAMSQAVGIIAVIILSVCFFGSLYAVFWTLCCLPPPFPEFEDDKTVDTLHDLPLEVQMKETA